MKMHTTKFVGVLLAMSTLFIGAAAASSNNGNTISPHVDADFGAFMASVDKDTIILGFPEYGWCNFTISATYNEEYTQVGSTLTLTKRTSSWDVIPSRTGSGAQAQTAFKVVHHNSRDAEVESFDMAMDDPSYYRSLSGSMTNKEAVEYNCTAGYYGTTNVTVYGNTFAGQNYIKELRNNFKVAPL